MDIFISAVCNKFIMYYTLKNVGPTFKRDTRLGECSSGYALMILQKKKKFYELSQFPRHLVTCRTSQNVRTEENSALKADGALHCVALVVSKPSAPCNLRVNWVTEDTISLRWEAPRQGGHLLHYIVEIRLSGKKTWKRVADYVLHTNYDVTGLTIGTSYLL